MKRGLPLGAMFGVYCIAVGFHLAVVLTVHWGAGAEALFPDARSYDSISTVIAGIWRGGTRPGTADLARMAGSEMWVYPTLMALCKAVTGSGWLGAKALLSVVSALGAPAAVGLAVSCGCGRRRATLAGLVVGTSPSLLLWDSWGLKEGLVIGVVLVTLLAQVRLRFPVACAVSLVGIQTCLYLRPAAALFLAVALLARFRRTRVHYAGLLVLGAALVLFVGPRWVVLFGLIDSLQIQEGTALGFTGGNGSTNLLRRPETVGMFLFGPFPWAFGPGTAVPERWLYIGTTVWIASLALLPAAVRRAWADTTGAGRSVLLGSAAYAVTYLATFGGAFYRQRSLLECMVILLVVLYLPLSPDVAARRVYLWLGAVGAVAVLQSSDLTPTPASKAAALAGMVLLAFVSVAPNLLRRFAIRDRGP